MDLFLIDKFLFKISSYLIRLEKIKLEVYFKFSSLPDVREWDFDLGLQVLQLFCLFETLTKQVPTLLVYKLQGVFKLKDLNLITSDSTVNIFYVLRCTLRNTQLLSFLCFFKVFLNYGVFSNIKDNVYKTRSYSCLSFLLKTSIFLPITATIITNDFRMKMLCSFFFKQRDYCSKFFLNILDIL